MPKGLTINTGVKETIHTLYQTDIVTIDHDKAVAHLESGGWMTMHTKKCINLALRPMGINLSQKAGNWYVSLRDGSVVPFQDGMRVSL